MPCALATRHTPVRPTRLGCVVPGHRKKKKPSLVLHILRRGTEGWRASLATGSCRAGPIATALLQHIHLQCSPWLLHGQSANKIARMALLPWMVTPHRAHCGSIRWTHCDRGKPPSRFMIRESLFNGGMNGFCVVSMFRCLREHGAGS